MTLLQMAKRVKPQALYLRLKFVKNAFMFCYTFDIYIYIHIFFHSLVSKCNVQTDTVAC